MKITIGTLVLTLAIFLHSIDLSLSFNNVPQEPNRPPQPHELHIFEADSRVRMPHVYFYTNKYGIRTRVSIAMPNVLASVGDFIIGVVIDGGIYPVWNRNREWVLVRLRSGQHVRMTPSLLQQYRQFYTDPSPLPRSASPNNRIPSYPANGHHEHN